jgi:hypothetical protein
MVVTRPMNWSREEGKYERRRGAAPAAPSPERRGLSALFRSPTVGMET